MSLTIRIPSDLKKAAAKAAALTGLSFSAFARMYMLDELVKKD